MRTAWPTDDDEVLSLTDVVELFRLGSLRTHRRMVRLGLFPRWMGEGRGLFYTGADVKAIRQLLGRWRPADAPRLEDEDEDEQGGAKPDKKAPKPTT